MQEKRKNTSIEEQVTVTLCDSLLHRKVLLIKLCTLPDKFVLLEQVKTSAFIFL